MAKTIKLSTAEKRFEKLHNIANFAEDYAKAIAFHAQLLIHEDQSGKQQFATMNMCEQLNDWAEQFAPLATEMQRVEALYYATADGDKVELVEAIPSTTGYPTEEPYKMIEELCKIGYIQIEGDPYLTSDKNYTDAEIVANVESMKKSMMLCTRALANANYNGVWKDVQKLANTICTSFPSEVLSTFLDAYCVNGEENA